MTKDLNDAAAKGAAAPLLGKAAASKPVAPADVSQLAIDGIFHLKAISSQVELDLRDPLDGPRLAAEHMVKATSAEKHRFILGAAYHERRAEVESLLAYLSAMGTKIKAPLSALRKVLNAARQEFGDSIRERDRVAGLMQEKRPKALLDAVVRELGLEGFRMPNGYEIDMEGVRTDSGERVSSSPILPVAIEVLPDGTVQVEVAWRKWGQWHRQRVPRRTLASSKHIIDLAQFGAPVDSISAPLLMSFFSAFEKANEAQLIPALSSPHVGWNGGSFLYGTTSFGLAKLVPPSAPNAVQFFEGLRQEGSWDVWAEAIEEYVAPYPSVMVGIYASVASLMLEPLGERGFVVDWSGLTSVGKTTTLMVAASSLGSPSESDKGGLIRSWRSPSNASRMYAASMLHNFPLYLDETKRANKPELVRDFLYDFPSGQDSMRSAEDGTARIAKRWRSIALTTGEAPITAFSRDGGAHARAICLQGTPWGTPTPLMAERQKRLVAILDRHYGHLGPKVVQYLLSTSWTDLKARHAAILAGYPVASGVAARMAAYVATIELAAQVCHLSLGVPGDSAASIKLLHSTLQTASNSSDIPRAALEVLYSWAAANREKFHRRGSATNAEPHAGWYGRWDHDDSVPEWIAFDVPKATRVLAEAGYDSSSVITAFRERGWLLLDKSGNNPQVGPSRSRLMAVKMSAFKGE